MFIMKVEFVSFRKFKRGFMMEVWMLFWKILIEGGYDVVSMFMECGDEILILWCKL